MQGEVVSFVHPSKSCCFFMQTKPGFVLSSLPEEPLNLFNEKIRGKKAKKVTQFPVISVARCHQHLHQPIPKAQLILQAHSPSPCHTGMIFPAFLQTKVLFYVQKIRDGIGKMGILDARGLSRLLCLVTPILISLTFDCLCCNENVLRA